MESDRIYGIFTRGDSPGPSRALGRGLGALLPSTVSSDAVRQIPITQIDPNPHQTRRSFHPDRLRELAESIVAHGVVQPIIVRKSGDRYLLIAGERRWRATAKAGVATIPAIVREVTEKDILELTLIENIQREDLDPIETAEAFSKLSEESGLTHDQIASRTGKDRTTITNYLRLLKLPIEVRERVASGELSMGHARALLSLTSAEAQKALAARIVAQGLSVRQTEALTKAPRKDGGRMETAKACKSALDPNVRAAIQEMERVLGTRVRIYPKGKKGKLEIEYYSQEDLDRIYDAIVGT